MQDFYTDFEELRNIYDNFLKQTHYRGKFQVTLKGAQNMTEIEKDQMDQLINNIKTEFDKLADYYLNLRQTYNHRSTNMQSKRGNLPSKSRITTKIPSDED